MASRSDGPTEPCTRCASTAGIHSRLVIATEARRGPVPAGFRLCRGCSVEFMQAFGPWLRGVARERLAGVRPLRDRERQAVRGTARSAGLGADEGD